MVKNLRCYFRKDIYAFFAQKYTQKEINLDIYLNYIFCAKNWAWKNRVENIGVKNKLYNQKY